MAVLETSFLIDILRGRKQAVDLLNELEEREPLFITTPTIMELWEGALRSQLPEKEMKKTGDMLVALHILDFDAKAAKKAAEINYELLHSPIEAEDSMIASIAFVHNEVLVTKDEHFVRISGLKILKY